MKSEPVLYGALVVLGYNGTLPGGDRGRWRSKLSFFRREKPNGLKPGQQERVKNPQMSQAYRCPDVATVSYTLSRDKAVVVTYELDETTDMFQIGRSGTPQIDLIVMDTVAAASRLDEIDSGGSSTISRFACRIVVEREPPHTARIFAAGFDSSKNIFLGEHAVRWSTRGQPDGLTTNGVLIHRPPFTDSTPSCWREISVGGNVYEMRTNRTTPNRHEMLEETNVLVNGTIIDICGAKLIWRSAEALRSEAPAPKQLENQVQELNETRPQCPVYYRTLCFKHPGLSYPLPSFLSADSSEPRSDSQPYVYLGCGHVHGQHEWMGNGQQSIANDGKRVCPLCMQASRFVELKLGLETAIYMDAEPPTHCFNSCGHMASAKTVEFWWSVPLPKADNSGFLALCPFCATPLEGPPVRLIFQ